MQSLTNTTTKKRRGPAPSIKDARRVCLLLPGDLVDRIDGMGKRSEIIRGLLERSIDTVSHEPGWGWTDSVDGE